MALDTTSNPKRFSLSGTLCSALFAIVFVLVLGGIVRQQFRTRSLSLVNLTSQPLGYRLGQVTASSDQGRPAGCVGASSSGEVTWSDDKSDTLWSWVDNVDKVRIVLGHTRTRISVAIVNGRLFLREE